LCIDAFYSEQAHLADLILPDGTYLERYDQDGWDSYDQLPYVSLRQPVILPLGQARDVRDILLELAHRIGDGMEKYFPWKTTEEYMEKRFAYIPSDERGVGGLARMKRDGVYVQKDFPKNLQRHYPNTRGYEFFKWELSEEQLKDSWEETITLPNGKK